MTDLIIGESGGDQVLAALDKILTKMEQQKRVTKELTDENSKLERAAKQVIQSQESGQERLNRLINERRVLMEKGKLTEQQFNKEVENLNKQLATMTGKFADLRKEQNGVTGADVLAKISGIAGGYLSVQKALQLVTKEMQAQQDLRDKAAAQAITVDAGQRVLKGNLIGRPDEEVIRIMREDAEIAQRTRTPIQQIDMARAQTMSASGGNIDASFNATNIAAQVMRHDPNSIARFAGTLLDLKGLTGSDDAMTNYGLLAAVSKNVRIVDAGKQATAVPGALVNSKAFGASPAEAAAMFAAITVASKDTEGMPSSTATISIFEQLQKFQQSQNRFLGAVRGVGVPNPVVGKSPAELIEVLQNNPAARAMLMEKFSLEKKPLGAFKSLLEDKDSEMSRSFRQFLEEFPKTNEGLKALGEQGIKTMDIDPFGVGLTQKLKAELESFSQQLALKGSDQLILSQDMKQIVSEILQRGGYTQTEADIKLQGLMGGKYVDLGTLIEDLRKSVTRPGEAGPNQQAREDQIANPNTREDVRQRLMQERVIFELINRLIELQKEQVQLQKENNARLQGGAGSSTPFTASGQ